VFSLLVVIRGESCSETEIGSLSASRVSFRYLLPLRMLPLFIPRTISPVNDPNRNIVSITPSSAANRDQSIYGSLPPFVLSINRSVYK